VAVEAAAGPPRANALVLVVAIPPGTLEAVVVVLGSPVARSGGTELFLAGRPDSADAPVVRAVAVVLAKTEAGVESALGLAPVNDTASRFEGDAVGPADSLLPNPTREEADDAVGGAGRADDREGRFTVLPASSPNCLEAVVVLVVVVGRVKADLAEPSRAG